MVTGRRLQPKCLDARLFRDSIRALIALDEALGRYQTRRIGAEKIAGLRGIGPLQCEIDSVEVVSFGMQVAGLGIEVGVVDFDVQVKVTLGGPRQRSRAIPRRAGQGSRLRRDAPIIAVAIQQGLARQRVDVQIAASGGECRRLVVILKHALRLRRQRIGDGAGTRQQ